MRSYDLASMQKWLESCDMQLPSRKVKTIKDFKDRLQQRITWVLALCVFAFVAVYLPREIQIKFVKLFGEVKITIQGLEIGNVAGFVTALSGIPLCFVLRWIIFAQDHLATSQSEPSRFFKYYYVTAVLRHVRPDIDKTQAVKMWFDLFNKWQSAEASQEEQNLFRRISERTYSLRLIWYLERVCLFFAIGAVVMLAVEYTLFDRATFVEYLPVKVSVLVFSVIVMVWLKRSNRFAQVESSDYFDRYEATGAYAKYKEIQGIAWETFKEIVLDGKCV